LIIAFNLILGVLPAIILGASWAAGTEDTRQHRTMFLLIFGLWSLTLAMWDWMKSAHVAWIASWAVAGVVALALFTSRRARPQ
jgi:hypothetical protein